MWQTLQRKAASSSSSSAAATPATRASIDDLGDAVLTYAEVKALATGNPLLLEQAARGRRGRPAAHPALARRADPHGRAHAADAADSERYRLLQQLRMLRSAAARIATTAAADDEDAVRVAVEAVLARVRRPDPDAPPAPVRAPWGGLGVELIPDGGWRVPRVTTC